MLNLNTALVKSLLQSGPIKNGTLIGRGVFSLVFQCPGFDNGVFKLTTDTICRDALFTLHGPHFPRLLGDYGVVGNVEGLPVYLMRVELLQKLKQSSEHRRVVAKMCKEISNVRSKHVFTNVSDERLNYLAITGIIESSPPYLKRALMDLAAFSQGHPQCSLDFHFANFMTRGDETLVFSDPLSDLKTLKKLSKISKDTPDSDS